MKTLLILALAVLLAGCATRYEIKRCEGDVCVEVAVETYREFPEGLAIRYDREAGQFEFSANQVTRHVSPIEQAAAALLLQYPTMRLPPQE